MSAAEDEGEQDQADIPALGAIEPAQPEPAQQQCSGGEREKAEREWNGQWSQDDAGQGRAAAHATTNA
jgi:hypothetical protein